MDKTFEEIWEEYKVQNPDTAESLLAWLEFQTGPHHGQELRDAAKKLHAAASERLAKTCDPAERLAIMRKAEAAWGKKFHEVCDLAVAATRIEMEKKSGNYSQEAILAHTSPEPVDVDDIFID
jgi:hypothetical protein